MSEPDVLRRNNVRLEGTGTQPLLLAHGFGCDQNMWRFVAPAFHQSHQVVLFDYVGSGRSDLSAYNEERYSTLHGYARDVLEIIHALDLRQVDFVGHSVSSMIGLLAAIQEPDRFSRLVLIGPSPCYINHPPDYVGGFTRADIEALLEMMEKNYVGWAHFLAPIVMKNEGEPELALELEESFCSTDPVLARRFAEATFFADNRDDLPKVTLPSLIMQCSEDSIAPPEVGDYLHERLQNSTLAKMRATGHCPHVSHPEETIALMKEYLRA